MSGLPSDEFHIEDVNQALHGVRGLGFKLPESMDQYKKKSSSSSVAEGDPADMMIESTNRLLHQITKGQMGEVGAAPARAKTKPVIKSTKKLVESGGETDAVDFLEKFDNSVDAVSALLQAIESAQYGADGKMLDALKHNAQILEQAIRKMKDDSYVDETDD